MTACIAQVTVPLVRISASYRATELAFSPSQVLIMSSAFSLLPAILAVSIGRFNDLHGNGRSAVWGAVLILLACVMLFWSGGGIWWLTGISIVLGLGQTLQLAALQGEIGMFRLNRHRHSMVGSLMLWQAVGQVAAPLLLSLAGLGIAPEAYGDLVFRLAILSASLALLGLAMSILQLRHAASPLPVAMTPTSIRRIVEVPGLAWVLVAGSLCVAVHDLVLVFMPVLGASRGVPVSEVGLLLACFALGQMISRAAYKGVVNWLGPRVLMFMGVLGTAVFTALLALPLNAALSALALALTGLAMGFAVTSSVSLTMDLAPPGARATSLGLRLAMNRAGQFLIPLFSGGAAAVLGPGAVFFVLGSVLGGAGLAGSRLLWRRS